MKVTQGKDACPSSGGMRVEGKVKEDECSTSLFKIKNIGGGRVERL